MLPSPTPEDAHAPTEVRQGGAADPRLRQSFDRLTRLAASILDAPIAVVTLIDGTPHWCTSAPDLDPASDPLGLDLEKLPPLSEDALVVADPATDARFANTPLVVGSRPIRFYAAAPLATPDGQRLGALAVMDHVPRDAGLTPVQQRHLRDLAALVADEIALHRTVADLEDARRQLDLASMATAAGLDGVLITGDDAVEAPRGDDPRQIHELRESERRYRLLFHHNPQPMWVYDSETLAFLDVNAAAESMYGYSREEFLASTILGIRPAEDADHVREMARQAPQGMARTGPWRHMRKDGSILFVRISSYPTVFEGRRARLVIAHDISAEHHLEEQLVQSQKMEAIGQLAGGVAHDFNNLLTVINGYAQLLLSRLHEADPLRVDAGHILQAGERAASLTQQLLAFSRRQVLQPRPLDVAIVIDNLQPLLRRVLRDDIDVRTSLPSALPPVMVDPVQLEQVLLNLAINGSDAMPGGGTLSLGAAEVTVDDEAAERQGLAPGVYVAVSVSDSGVGMDDEIRTRIFEPFFTTKPKGRGSGLGLPVVYGIVKQSGGNIVVRTAPGEGSTFTVYLPLAEARPDVEEAAPASDAATLQGHETVLVVEDHEALRRLAVDVLRAHGYHVLAADRGPDAIALVQSRGGGVDLLLTDVIMPRMSGREVATALRRIVPDLGVLFMSGYTETAMADDALDAGWHFLAKPFTPAELLARVREVLATRARHGDTTSSAEPAAADATPPAGAPRVVVADDEPGLRLLLAATLSGAGYEVLEATNGLEALRLCEGGVVDLLLTDLVMPDHEGLETIRRMRQQCPNIPVVAMSGAFDGGFLEVARAMGAAAVIQKPFTPDQVVRVVGRVLEDKATPP